MKYEFSEKTQVMVTGYSTCSDDRLDGPFIWTGKVESDQIAEWQIYFCTPENREKLGLPTYK
jgi:hypothetical protein